MTVEPIRSTLATVSTDDTSLVLPTDKMQRTGQQRVLEQVKSIKRNKSKMVKKDSIPSPTSPASMTEYSEPKFQFSPTNMNGTLFKSNGSSMTASHKRMVKSHTLCGSLPNITLQEAVEFLSNSDISYQLCGASFIQHQTFTEESTKQEVWRLGGIPALIQLLKSDNSQLHQTAAAALRNLAFKDHSNKLEVDHCEGIEAILTLLRNSNDTETHKQLTGLLWNLSSADKLKPELIRNALPLLTETIVVPYSIWTDSNTNKLIDPEVFYNTTGCVRNLSCASEDERITMRSCPQLIDSLVTYIQTQMDRGEPDDKQSVENCVCILHNLSYQLETEAPEQFKQISVLDTRPKENNNKSLFSPKSSKTQKVRTDFKFPAMEKEKPEGVNWLYNQKTLQLYRSLLGSSQKEATLEACCGALQNLTASKSSLSTLMSQSFIEKLNGLPVISPLLISGNSSLQKTAMSLVGNMSRVSSLRGAMAKDVFPMVSPVLSNVTSNMIKSDSTIATACRVMQTLMLAEPETSKKMISPKLVESLTALSSNM
uniref:Plakophilin 1 n=1 Tax=Cyprinus carpio TaxID=7962 RepID=A0A8C2BWL9_CYPCA